MPAKHRLLRKYKTKCQPARAILGLIVVVFGLYALDYLSLRFDDDSSFSFLSGSMPLPLLTISNMIDNKNFSIYNITESEEIRLNFHSPIFMDKENIYPRLIGLGTEKSGSTSVGGMIVQTKMYKTKTSDPKRTELRYWIKKHCNFNINDSFTQILKKMGYSITKSDDTSWSYIHNDEIFDNSIDFDNRFRIIAAHKKSIEDQSTISQNNKNKKNSSHSNIDVILSSETHPYYSFKFDVLSLTGLPTIPISQLSQLSHADQSQLTNGNMIGGTTAVSDRSININININNTTTVDIGYSNTFTSLSGIHANTYHESRVQSECSLANYFKAEGWGRTKTNTKKTAFLGYKRTWGLDKIQRAGPFDRKIGKSINTAGNNNEKFVFLRPKFEKSPGYVGLMYITQIYSYFFANSMIGTKIFLMIRYPAPRIQSAYVVFVGPEKDSFPDRYGDVNIFVQYSLKNRYLNKMINELKISSMNINKTHLNNKNVRLLNANSWINDIFPIWNQFLLSIVAECSNDMKKMGIKSAPDDGDNNIVSIGREMGFISSKSERLEEMRNIRRDAQLGSTSRVASRVNGGKRDNRDYGGNRNNHGVNRASGIVNVDEKGRKKVIQRQKDFRYVRYDRRRLLAALKPRVKTRQGRKRKGKRKRGTVDKCDNTQLLRRAVGISCYITPIMQWVLTMYDVSSYFRIIQSESFFRSPEKIFNKLICWDQDGTVDLKQCQVDKRIVTPRLSQKESKQYARSKTKIQIINNQTKRELETFFKPCNLQLYELLRIYPEIALQEFDWSLWNFDIPDHVTVVS